MPAQGEASGKETGIKRRKRIVKCDPIAHQNHLCFLIAHRRVAKARSLEGDGRYRCTVCDRVAAAPESLCDPVDRHPERGLV